MSTLITSRKMDQGSFTQALFKGRSERWQDLEQITHHSITGNFKNRRISNLLDRHNDLAGAHACQVLDGSRNAIGNVQIRSDDFTGLTNLM